MEAKAGTQEDKEEKAENKDEERNEYLGGIYMISGRFPGLSRGYLGGYLGAWVGSAGELARDWVESSRVLGGSSQGLVVAGWGSGEVYIK